MSRCKVYKDYLKANSIDDEFKEQFKNDILNEFRMFLNTLKDDVIHTKNDNNIKRTLNFSIS